MGDKLCGRFEPICHSSMRVPLSGENIFIVFCKPRGKKQFTKCRGVTFPRSFAYRRCCCCYCCRRWNNNNHRSYFVTCGPFGKCQISSRCFGDLWKLLAQSRKNRCRYKTSSQLTQLNQLVYYTPRNTGSFRPSRRGERQRNSKTSKLDHTESNK